MLTEGLGGEHSEEAWEDNPTDLQPTVLLRKPPPLAQGRQGLRPCNALSLRSAYYSQCLVIASEAWQSQEPPSAEGGGFLREQKDEGREKKKNIQALPQALNSLHFVLVPAPSTEGAEG